MKIFVSIFCSIIAVCSACRNTHYKSMPSFDLQLIDSSTIMNTQSISGEGPIALLYFSPNCDHCQEQTREIVSQLNYLKSIKFYFITSDPLDSLKVYGNYYKIDTCSNITLGRDYTFAFQRLFNPPTTPFIVLYDRKKRERAVFSGIVNPEKLLDVTKDL